MSGFLRLLSILLVAGFVLIEADEPFMSVPLPKSVTKTEDALGVSDNQLPDHGHTVSKGKFALSGYDQQILANGPPAEGDGPDPNSAAAPPPPPASNGYYQMQPQYGSYGQSMAGQPAYGQPVYGQTAVYGQPAYGQTAYGQQSYGQPAYQPQNYQQYSAYGQPSYQYQQQYQYQGYQSPQYQAQNGGPPAAGSQYYDYSQANGKLTGANSDIASAAAFVNNGQDGKYSKFGWHPTLARELGIPKSQRGEAPRLHLTGQLAKMASQKVPKPTPPSPSVDPHQKNVAAIKLAKAQALLRKNVAQGLKLSGTKAEDKIALGKPQAPCRSLKCERSRVAEEEHNGYTPQQNVQQQQQQQQQQQPQNSNQIQQAQQRVAAKHANAMQEEQSRLSPHASSYSVTSSASLKHAARRRAAEQALANKAGFGTFGEDTEKEMMPAPDTISRSPRVTKAGSESTLLMGLLMGIFVGFVAMGVVVAIVHARRERKRNQLQAMSGFT